VRGGKKRQKEVAGGKMVSHGGSGYGTKEKGVQFGVQRNEIYVRNESMTWATESRRRSGQKYIQGARYMGGKSVSKRSDKKA